MGNETGALLAEIKNVQKGAQSKICRIRLILDELDNRTADDLRQALADPKIHGSVIARVLQSRDIDVSERTVQRHRKGDCNCD